MEQSVSKLVENDKKYVLHSMSQYNPESSKMIIKEADGAWITDINGKKYLEGKSGLFCINVGFGRKELAQAAYDQLNTMPYYPLSQSHIPAIRLGEKLNEWLEDDYVIFFSNSGSEANETALKIARQYHQQNGDYSRHKFIARYRGYHGSTMGALAATGQAERKHQYEPFSPGFIHVSPPDNYRCPDYLNMEQYGIESANIINQTMTWERSDSIAGVIMEPIITGGGIIVPPDNYLQRVREICNHHGALLIMDEVICGFGRTGKKFGFMNYDIKPDIITMAKGLTSSYLPLSATAVRKDLLQSADGKDTFGHFRHVNTFGGNPAACSLAIKNMEIIENEGLTERSAELGEWIRKELSVIKSHPNVGDIRGKGLLFGIELVENKETKQPADDAKVNKIIAICKENGLIIGKNGNTVAGYNNVITMGPPLSITNNDAEFIVKIIKDAFKQL